MTRDGEVKLSAACGVGLTIRRVSSTNVADNGERVKMKHAKIVQALLDLHERPAYLEVGVEKGDTFLAVTASRKVAVDPRFRFDVDEASAANPNAVFHAMKSDAYFGNPAWAADRFDVIFLDGLHTFEQTLRDFCSAVFHLNPGGAIVIDDVKPFNYESSLRKQKRTLAVRAAHHPKDTRRDWTGDVYRVLFFIEAFFQQWSFAAVKGDLNQLVVWRERRSHDDVRRRPVEKIARLPYERTVLSPAAYRVRTLDDIVDAVRRSRPDNEGLLPASGA